jgi:hypothetical protein
VYISGLDITSNYDFRVQAENLIGVSSTGTTLSNQALSGDTTAPSAPTSGSATGGIQTITAEWNNPSDIDFKHVEVYVNTSNSIPANPTSIVDGEEYVVTGLTGVQTRYFWLKSVDFSGNKSAATSSFNATSVVAGSSDIADDAVGSDQIANEAVGSDQIADDAVGSDQIATGAVDITAFASGIQPVQVVSSLPGSASEGDTAYLTTDNKLYRYDGSAWIKAVDGADVSAGTLPAASIVTNSITAGQIATGAINTDELAANSVNADKIQVNSITANKISGDISEVFSFGLYNATSTTLSSSFVTFGQFTTPAPDADISKYATLHAHFGVTAQSPNSAFTVEVDIERKSKGVATGVSIGSVVASGSFAQGARYVEFSGSLLTTIDLFGGISTTQTSATSVYNVVSIEYQPTTDRTKIIYASSDAITVGTTVYYNQDKWTSSGDWITYAAVAPRYGIIGVTTLTHHTIFQPLARSNAEETYRVRAKTHGFSGTSVTMSVGIAGQIQLLT